MEWRQLTMDLGTLDADIVEAVFAAHGASAVTLTDAGDSPVLEPSHGEMPLWPRTRITGLFAADADLDALLAELCATLAVGTPPRHHIETLGDRVWEREWLRDFAPMRFGRRLWISPTTAAVEDADAVVVELDPGLAFGTGTHETTALCLEWLDSLPLAGRTLLDIGCGSGILAIAGLKLDARAATGVDIDPQAITASRANAAANGVADRLALTTGIADVTGTFDVVVANILAAPLIELASIVAERTVHGGAVALSGILADQVGAVVDAYHHWFDFAAPLLLNDWACLTGKRR